MKIFAADDEALALEYLRMAIEKAAPFGTELSCFRKPSALLAAAQENCPDIAFLDIQMPGMKGLDLAKALMTINPKINIIFVTGFSEYLSDAFKMFASGYVLKPVSEAAVKEQLAHLRYPVRSENDTVIKTFGHFTVYYKGRAVDFRLQKSKELLAYLVDRNGALVSRREIFAALYEDEEFDRNAQKNLSKIVKGLETDLETAGITGLFIRNDDGCYVDKTRCSCDLFEFLDEGKRYLFRGEYMEQYFWGEDFKGRNS